MKKVLAFLLLCIFLIVSPKFLGNDTDTHDGLRSVLPYLKFGTKIPQSATATGNMILTNPSQFWPESLWSYSGIEYSLGVDNRNTIQFISTTSQRLKTPSGVYVGMSLSELRDTLGVELVKRSGWAWSVALPSGWHAAFTCGERFTDCEPVPSDTFDFIYDSP